MSDDFREEICDGWDQRLRVDAIIHEERTACQHIVVFQSRALGRVLVLDGVIQTTQADEFIYHEMMAHVPILAHGHARRVLIIGGGDGGLLREALHHRTLDRAVLVEIDQSVIDLCRRHLPDHSKGAFDDPRTAIVIDDGLHFLQTTDERFDVILTDSTDPAGPAAALFSRAYYTACQRCLSPGGVLVTQNGVAFLQLDEVRESAVHFAALFRDWHFYTAAIPSYTGGLMAFGWASDDPDLRRQGLESIQQRFSASRITTRYYTPALHLGAFALPRYILDAVGKPNPSHP